jgi:hypothetical protein
MGMILLAFADCRDDASYKKQSCHRTSVELAV